MVWLYFGSAEGVWAEGTLRIRGQRKKPGPKEKLEGGGGGHLRKLMKNKAQGSAFDTYQAEPEVSSQ
jgi:hypothetical protein